VFFKKLFGKKNDGFYIQLEDEDAKSTPVAKAPVPVAPVAPAAPPAPTVSVAPAPTASAVAVPAAKTDPKQVKADKKAAQADKKAPKKAETPKVETAPAPVAAPPQPTITNFATDYLIKPSSNSGRRRPGANMRQFVDLARQMEKPIAFKATAAERKPEKPTAEKPRAEKPTAEKPSTEQAAESISK
jgi:hypothetical protein